MNDKKETIAIYGFGRAGRSIVRSVIQFTDVNLIVYSTKEHAPRERIEITNDESTFFEWIRTRSCVSLIIAVPDDAVTQVAHRIADYALPKFVAHLCGVLSEAALYPLSPKSVTAQFHPLVSLNGVSEVPFGSFVAISSTSDEARQYWTSLAKVLRCSPHILKDGDQPLYHAAASLTGNLALGLVSMSLKMLEECGVEKTEGRIALARLLKSAALAVEENPLEVALTGPLARGDQKTISKHLGAFQKLPFMNQVQSTYLQLTNELLDQLTLSEEKKKEILSLSTDAC